MHKKYNTNVERYIKINKYIWRIKLSRVYWQTNIIFFIPKTVFLRNLIIIPDIGLVTYIGHKTGGRRGFFF